MPIKNSKNEKSPKAERERVISPVIKSKILYTHNSRFAESSKVSSSHNLVPLCSNDRKVRDTATVKLRDWRIKMLQTFENLLLQLDELILSLKTDDNSNSNTITASEKNIYKGVCEKLRLEIIVAVDKLEMKHKSNNKFNEAEIEFLDRMNTLKSQLSQIRWQYHQAIQQFNLNLSDKGDVFWKS